MNVPIFVLNGWAASPHAWDLCRFMRPQQVAALPTGTTGVSPVEKSAAIPRLFSYVEQLDGLPEQALEATDRCILVGWSMGGSSALRLVTRFPEKIAGLVLIAATPRMMEDKATGWRGMTPHRLEALRYGLLKTQGIGFFGVPEGKPNPYLVDVPANLERGLKYLLETDVRKEVVLGASCLVPSAEQKEVPGASCFVLRAEQKEVPGASCLVLGAELKHKDGRESNAPSTKHQALGTNIHIFQSEHDGIVRPENAAWLKTVFPQASVTMIPGTEHALPIFIPEKIDDAVDACLAVAQKG